MNPVSFKLVREGALLPKRGTPDSGAFDIYAPEAGFILPGERQPIPTGIAHDIEGGLQTYFYDKQGLAHPVECKLQGMLIPRSGLALKKGMRLFFSPCLIDHDYRGEIIVLAENQGTEIIRWERGERIVQIAYIPMYMGSCSVVEELTATSRGEGGFGSTGLR